MSAKERLVDPSLSPIDHLSDQGLRPKGFDEFIGQRKIIDNIDIMVQSSKMRKAAMDHILFSGPPGLGKTSLATIVAQALGSELHTIAGPAIERKGDLAAVLTNLGPRDILFIDEIHRIHVSIEEILYSAMEDFRLDILIGQGAGARTMEIAVAPFTLIGATTKSGLLSNPLRDRFMAHFHFDFYEAADLSRIIENSAKKLCLPPIEAGALQEMAERSRGTPRIANRILRRVRDFTLVGQKTSISLSDVRESLALLEIDSLGLDNMDRRILQAIKDYYKGGPVGIDAICATLGEERSTIEDVYEPYLLKQGLLARTPRGRMLSKRGMDHIS
ncbi:MAG: Holliday junction branch migration DNA helicase RuvB [Bacteriovoracales bacterium]|nr:Holliday junction branch migration DNA helicase RuvB [Bacteriovoracales bacterium]